MSYSASFTFFLLFVTGEAVKIKKIYFNGFLTFLRWYAAVFNNHKLSASFNNILFYFELFSNLNTVTFHLHTTPVAFDDM